jgi:hypothetical protein
MGIKIKNAKNAKFEPPTLQEVVNQFEIKGVTDEDQPALFMAYYMSIDWHVGRNKMRSWRAAVAGWVIRMSIYSKPKTNDKFSEEAVRARMANW